MILFLVNHHLVTLIPSVSYELLHIVIHSCNQSMEVRLYTYIHECIGGDSDDNSLIAIEISLL
jgi:hypothetical protein